MGATFVVMPQMGESLTEGTVVRWLKAPGEAVKRDEPLLEISTDKVDTEIPSPVDGRLSRILVAAGERVAVGAAVAVIETAGGGAEPAPQGTSAPADGGHFKAASAAELVRFPRASKAKAAPDVGAGRSFSPAVLGRAREAGVSLASLASAPGSGRGGRLTKRDVERLVRSANAGEAASPELPGPPPEYLYRPEPEDTVVPMSPLRRRIADHMSWSVRLSPQATAFAECDASRLAWLLSESGKRFEQAAGVPLTYTALVSRVLVGALREFPVLNASVVGESLVLKPRVHLGVAVALPDEEGLVVPVIRDADSLSVAGLARAVFELAARARARRLAPADVQGGSFTLTNPGVFGGVSGTPILNQPQVAILGLGAVTKRVVVVDDAIAIRPVMTLSLTIDHRAADGMTAFRFLERLRKRLEQMDEREVLA